MNFPPVLTKADFVRRYALGEFGNASPTYNTVDELMKASYNGLYHLRNRVAGGATYYNLSRSTAVGRWMVQQDWGQWYASEMAPTEKTLFQGEVVQSIKSLDLYYSTLALPMREALAKQARSVSGIIAVSLLRAYLCPNSYEWLMTLLDRYPGHVVELSTYSVNWGTVPNYNSVFWEVRAY